MKGTDIKNFLAGCPLVELSYPSGERPPSQRLPMQYLLD